MEYRSHKMSEFIGLMERHATQDGLIPTSIDNLFTIRATQPDQQRHPEVYPPAIVIVAQGQKNIYLGGKQYEYSAGNFLALFVSMAVECGVVKASPDKPLLAVGIAVDLNRITQIILNMDRFEKKTIKPAQIDASGIFSAPIKDNLLDATIRLLRGLDSPCEAAILSEAIIDEIYFRILSEEQGGNLKYLLQQRGQIQQISKAIEYVHQHLDEPVSVDDLADMVNMSSSGFHKKFKQVMHLSPLQYAKSIKLNRAQTYIMDGKSVTEASYMVGYNNLAQFSREFKRHFGVLPSAVSA